jgi:hypothetical protein
MDIQGEGLTFELFPAKEVKIHPVGQHTHTLIWLHELASWGSLKGAAFNPNETKLPFAMKLVCPSALMMKRKLLLKGPVGFCAVQLHIEGKSVVNSWDLTMIGVER